MTPNKPDTNEPISYSFQTTPQLDGSIQIDLKVSVTATPETLMLIAQEMERLSRELYGGIEAPHPAVIFSGIFGADIAKMNQQRAQFAIASALAVGNREKYAESAEADNSGDI